MGRVRSARLYNIYLDLIGLYLFFTTLPENRDFGTSFLSLTQNKFISPSLRRLWHSHPPLRSFTTPSSASASQPPPRVTPLFTKMDDVQTHDQTQALAQILESEQHHYHPPDFAHPRHLKGEDGHLHLHAHEIPTGEDDTGGEEDLDLALGDLGNSDNETPARTSSFGRPPSIRKGETARSLAFHTPCSADRDDQLAISAMLPNK